MTPIISKAHRKIGVPLGSKTLALYPEAQIIQVNNIPLGLVPHNIDVVWHLRQEGYKVPSPSKYHYDYPGGTPYKAQIETVDLLTTNNRAYVLNDMGTGKTKSTIWAWDFLHRNGLAKSALVVAPLSTLKFTWQRELLSTVPDKKVTILHGTKKERLKGLSEPADFYIINHDGIATVLPEVTKMVAAGEITHIIIDELAVYRNGQARRTKVMKALSEKAKWVWGLTGRPTPNAPTDAWSQCAIITPHTVPKFFGRFRDMTMTKVTQFKYVPKSDAVDTVFKVMQPAVRFTLDEVDELPDCVEQFVEVGLGKTALHVYAEMFKQARVNIHNSTITAANAGAVMNKLLQVSLGYVYKADHTTVVLDNQERLDAITNAVMNTSRKSLVFVPYTNAAEHITAELTAHNVKVAMVTGDTSANERNNLFNQFQTTNALQCLVAHPACLAHGITLTEADTIVWAGPIASLEIYDQANHRIRRIGQKHKQYIIKITGTPVEKKIYKLLDNKQNIQTSLLSLFEEATETLL